MKQKIFLTIAILSLLGLAVFVSATRNTMVGINVPELEPSEVDIPWGRYSDFETTVELNEGWNLLGYLRLEAINLESLFTEPLLSEIIIIKNSDGLAFLPEYDYNGIGDFEPGLGYQIKINSTQAFYYLEN